MKLLVFLVSLLLGVAFAASPIDPAVNKELKRIRANAEQVLRVDFDARTSSKTEGSIVYANGSISEDALISDVKMYVDNIVTSAAGNPVSLGCESAADLMASASYEQAVYATNYQVQGIPTNGATSGMVYTDGCTPYVTVGSSLSALTTGITDGRLVFRIKYIPIESAE